MSDQLAGRPTPYSRVTLSRIMNATDVNLYGTVHGGDPLTVATAYLVLVGVDVSGHPRAIPPVLPETPEDERRFREALIRP